MHTVIRNYAGAPSLADELKKRGNDIDSVMRSIPGFVAYYLIKTADGTASVTVCETSAGCDESSKRAADWLRQNLPNLKLNPPQVIAGDLALKFANYKTTSV